MKGKILVTDSLFISTEHEQKLMQAGYEIERLDVPCATEEQLVEAIKSKVGYILGGIEKVTERIIEAGDKLRVISFTGIDYKAFIPGWEYALKKGIHISNTPDAPSHAVAEWAVTVALAMNRGIFDIGRTGKKDFMTTPGLENKKIGIIGLGRVGKSVIEKIKVFNTGKISYYSRHRHQDAEEIYGIEYKPLEIILSENDIIFLCVSEEAGKNFISKKELHLMKDQALLVSSSHSGLINEEALLSELQKSRIRVAVDYPLKSDGYLDIPVGLAYFSNGQNGFNTEAGIKRASDTATQSMINLLESEEDKNKVN